MRDSNGAWVSLIRFSVVHAFICDGVQTRDLDCLPFGASLPLQRVSMRMKEKEGKTITRENVLEVLQCIRWTRMCRPPSKAAEMRSCGISAKAEMLSSAGHFPKHSLFEGAICEGPQGLLEVYVFRPPPLLSPPRWMSTFLPTLPRKLLSVKRIHPRRFVQLLRAAVVSWTGSLGECQTKFRPHHYLSKKRPNRVSPFSRRSPILATFIVLISCR
jgi:hypothetical protein